MNRGSSISSVKLSVVHVVPGAPLCKIDPESTAVFQGYDRRPKKSGRGFTCGTFRRQVLQSQSASSFVRSVSSLSANAGSGWSFSAQKRTGARSSAPSSHASAEKVSPLPSASTKKPSPSWGYYMVSENPIVILQPERHRRGRGVDHRRLLRRGDLRLGSSGTCPGSSDASALHTTTETWVPTRTIGIVFSGKHRCERDSVPLSLS
jgi:hypothetical protein